MPSRFLILSVGLGLILYFAGGTSAEELLAPAANAPQYQLSNLRTDRDALGRRVIAMDFKRTRQGEGSVSVGGQSSKGRIFISAWIPPSEDSGTIGLQNFLGGDITTDIELYLVQEHRLSATKTVCSIVSNAVRMGNPGNASTARAWTEEEKAMHKEFARIMNDDSAHKPPSTYPVSVQVPAGSEFVDRTWQRGNAATLETK